MSEQAKDLKTSLLVPLLPTGRSSNILYRAGLGLAESPVELNTLISVLNKSASSSNSISIPSHFADLLRKYDFTDLKNRLDPELDVYFQIGLGQELESFVEGWVQDVDPRYKIELLLERSPTAHEATLIEKVLKAYQVRFLLIPTLRFNIFLEMENMPEFILKNIFVVFLPKISPQDEFLNLEETRLMRLALRRFFAENNFSTFQEIRLVERPDSSSLFARSYDNGAQSLKIDNKGKYQQKWSRFKYLLWLRLWTQNYKILFFPSIRPVLRFIFYPLLKIYWFSEYQYKKRVKGLK